MTKKDYEKFANLIKGRTIQRTDWLTELLMLANDMVKIFQEDNPRFNREKFLTACGVISGTK